jgi:bacterioferritin (cytochrome b1)
MVRYPATGTPTTRVMIEGILAKEEEHAKHLVGLLATLDPTKPA